MTIYVSISDISTFLSCRKRWDYSSSNRQNLRHKATPRAYLQLGTAMHKALEADVNGEDPIAALTEYITQERDRQIEAIQAERGSVWDMDMEKFNDMAQTAGRLAGQYFRRYGRGDTLSDQQLKYIAAELSFDIPLDFLGLEDVHFVGTIDGVAIDPNGEIFLVENKTYTAKPDVEELQFHFQSNGYAVAWTWLTGLPVKGVLYNGISKTLIQLPKKLKNGKLSTDKRQPVTMQSYLAGMQEIGADAFDPYYFEILNYLQEREKWGDTRFFLREMFYYEQHQLDLWQTEFKALVGEMYGYLDDSVFPVIYRTVPYNGCGERGADCWYRDLCHAEVLGQDVDLIKDQKYRTSSYGTVETVQNCMEPIVVSSVEDLLETLKRSE